MAAPQNNNNVEMEAAKFLHKLIQESTDEPTKLATKLHVILQHMRSSGKENSMPYQVISRAMETVINRHGLDMEALISSRPPLTSGSQAGESSFSQIAGTSQQIAVEDNSKKTLNPEQPVKVAAFSGKLLHGSSSAGHESYQGSANHLNTIKSHGSNAGFSGSYESLDVGNPRSMQFSSLYDNQSAATLMHKGPGGKALDHEAGFQNVMSSTSKTVQGGIYSNIAALGLLQNESSRDIGKSPASQGSLAGSSMPFKEHHLKQLRAQCLVFLAFRNSLMPKKLHLEIALGNVFPKEDLSSKEYADQKGKDPSIGPGSSSSGFVSETNLSKEGEKLDRMIDKNDPLSGLHEHSIIQRKFEANMQAFEAKEAQTSSTKVAIDPTNISGLFDMHDSQGNRHSQSLFSSVPLREGWKSHSGMEGDRHMIVPKNANVLEKDVMLGAGHEDDTSELCALPASPKYTTSEKWITDCQKRKVSADYNWAVKKKKTEQKISACVEKLKETVSSSEDISAKTKSVIELKKLELLNLQRRLRNEILNDFFRPTSAEMDRVKSIKKHRIGRRSKQLERHEQKMKEERQKRIRERQKDFFGELELHRERLEDVFKFRRERLKGFNKYAREFHKRKERLHREKIDRIQREKINLLKINDVEGYLRMVQDAKSDRVKQLLKETEKYLQKLGTKLKEAKVISRCFETDMGVNDGSEFIIENEDETDQAKHYMESNEKYYLMAHSIKETVAEQPTSLVGGKLREYQMNGLRWLLSLYNNHLNGILADEMGLGKTVQVISLLCYLMENKNDRGPFLVVVPSSVLPGWESEINFWAPSINKIVYSGPPEERRRLFKERIVQQKFNVLLTTYEYLMNKHDRPKLSKIHWHYVIIDEGHRIKNASCKLNADLKHYHSSHRLLLTGTPLQNNLEELWALLNFLLPNIFNSSEDFSQWFNKPFESNADNSLEEALLSEEENLLIINRLHQVLRPFVLRRLKHKVENELPEKIERLVRCEASAYQKLLMQRVEDNLGAFGASKSRAVHNSVVELRNICNHPYISQLHTEEVHDFVPKHYLPNIIRFCGKLEMLDRLLPKLKATDHRILLFSTMTRLLDVMEDYLYWKQYKYLRLDGHTSGGDRGALIDQFNKPGSPFFIFLLSIRAGGVGVNLQAADTVIIFDTDWNPQVDLQAQARAHRIGQKKDVLVLRLETVKTVEEQVRASAEHKLGVANQSITAGFFDNNTSAEDRREYLEALLRECKKEEAAPVLNDDALNDIIARSESEIDVFEEIDKKRQEEELVVWERLVSEQGGTSSEFIPPLPSRLVTENELTSFCEAMKAIEVPKPVVVPGIGGKRKGELGNLDVQHYGRGKRAREVRSYEEQWTEDEFEKLCQAENSGSPNGKEEPKERDLAIVKSESGVVIGSEGAGSPNVKSESGVVIGSEGTELPNIQTLQPTADSTVQQMKDLNTPSKRGRGRPKKNLTGVSPSSVGRPASQGPVTSTAKTVNPAVNPLGFQPAASHSPGFQSSVIPGYKSMTTPPPGYQPISASPGYQQITPPPPGFQPKCSSSSPLTASQETDSLVSCLPIPTPGPSSLSTTGIHAGSQSTTTVPASQSKSTPHSNSIASTNVPPGILSSPASPLGPVSMPMLSPTSPNSPSAISPIVTPGRGRGQGRGRGRGQGRGRGRGQIIESEVGVPQRRGRKSPNVVLAIPGLRTSSLVGEPETNSLLAPSTDSETTAEQKVSTSAAVNDASNTPVSASLVNFPVNLSHRPDIASPRTPVPIASIVTSSVLTNTSETLDAGTLQTLVSDSIGSKSTDVGILSSQTAMPLVTAPIGSHSMSSNPVLNQGRGRGRKVVHGGIEAPRRRRKEDAADTQEQKSNEPVQKRTRVSSGRKTIATRSMLRNEAQKRTDQASITDDRSTHVSSLAKPSVNSASHAKDQPNTSAEIDASTIDGSPSTQWENVVKQKNILVAKESGKKTRDIDITKSKEEMHPQKLPILEVQGEMESKPESLEMGESKTHKKEKLSHVEDSFPQKVESFKLEADHKDRVAARSALEDANTNNKLDVDAAVDELSAENKSEKDDPVIDDGGVLEAVEANPTEKSNLPCPGASEVVQAVEKTAVEIVQKPSSPVLLSDTERADSTTSFEKIAKISQATIKHEKEQVATDPFMEVDVDSNKTSSELAITQVEMGSKSESLEKGDSEPRKEAEKSSFGEDSVSQKAESFKVEVEHKEHVATDPLMEVNDDSNKTSSELAITQVEMGSKSEFLEKGDSEPPKEADKSSFGENSVSQKAESFKVEDEHKEHVASNPFMEVDDDSNKTSSELAITQVEMWSKSESPEKGDSEPLKEAEKSSFGGDSVSQIAESFKVDVEHKEHVATDPFMEVDDDSNKTSSEVEIGSKSESPEKGDSEYPKGEKLSFGEDSVSQKAESFKAEVEHKEQVATDPFMEADVDSNDTSSELSITQGEMGSKSESFEKGDSEPDKEAEKFSFGVDSLSQNSESFKGEVEQEEQVAECSASDDVGKIKIIEVDATMIELSPEMKSEKDEPVIDDRGPLEAMEAYPAEEINVSCHDVSEVVPQLEEIEVEIAQEASSPVLQSETERTDTLFENESPSSKMNEKIYSETIEHEKEQVATDTVMEEVDASNETSSELTITQVKMESKSGSPEKVMFEPNKEVEKSSHGEDSLPQSVEHFKEKIEREEQVAECCTSKDAVKNNEWEADAAVIELSAEKKREKEDPAIDDGETLQSLEGKPAEEVRAALHRASEVVPAVDEILFEMNEVEKSSHGAESLPQNVEHFKAEIKHEERVAECIASKDAGKNNKSEADAAVIQLSAEKKSVKEDHAIDDGGTLQAVEGKPAEEVQAALRGTSEVVTAVDEIVVEIACGASSSVLQSELERTDFLFETGRIDSQRTIVHEMEQAAIGSITEDADDSTKTLLEFSITQGGREFKSEFEPHSVTKSSQGEDSLPQKFAHFKEKVEHMGHVIECKAAQNKKMEVDAAINELFTEKKSEKEDHAIDGGTLEASPAAEECPVALHEANEVVPAVVEIVKEPLSPVLQNEPERPNSTFETEASSFEMIKKISEGKIELENEQVATDSMMEDVDESNKTSPELAITQVKVQDT